MMSTKSSSEGGTSTTSSVSTAGSSSTGSQQHQQNRKMPSSLSSTITSADLLSPNSRSFRNASSSSSLTYSNSLRSNRTAAVSSHYSTSSPIKKTNSFSNLDSSTFPLSTNQLSSTPKFSRSGKLARPFTNHLKANVKTTRSLIVPKLSLEHAPSSLKQESDSVNKLSKRLGNAYISNGPNNLNKTNGISLSEASTSTMVESSSALPESVASNIPGCSRSNTSDTSKEHNRSSLSPNSFIRLNNTINDSSDDDNFDELGQLEVNKCNITEDSDDSVSNKSSRLRFLGSKSLIDSLPVSMHPSLKQTNNNQPVNQTLPSPQSSHNTGENQSNKSGQSNLGKSICNTSSVLPLRNCHVHRGSISSNDLMSSSNYGPNHRLHSTSYNPSSPHCCHFRHHHHHYDNHRLDSLIPLRTSQCVTNQKNLNPFELGMSSIEATSIISSHCNTENNTSASNSAAITKLTASSISGLPVSALTVMESPNLYPRTGSYNWQAFMSTLKDRMATIFNRELLADVHFIVGKGNAQTRFPAHKFVLSIGSAVFDAMFNGPLTRALNDERSKGGEAVSNGTCDDTEIELPDVEPEAFQALLRFLYLDEVQIGPESVMATLYVAKKYEVTALEMACVDFLKANLNPENAFMMLTQARLFDEVTLADLCLSEIDKHAMDSLFSDSFFDIDLDTLKLVLNRDSLRCRELSLFLAAMRWAELECIRRSLELNSENKRKVLGEALYLIRFPLMTIEEFAHNVAQSELLTDKELVNLFLYFTVSSKPSVPFSIEPRCCITGEEHSVNRFQRTESRWGYSGTSDRIRFLTDRPIFITGLGLFGSIHGPSEYEAVIEVIHTGSGKVVATNTTSFVSDGSDSVYRVMFKYPVEITQNTNYTACATLKGVDSYYGTNGYRTVTVNLGKGDSKGTVTFQFSYAAGCNNGTSVEDGQIPEILFYT